MGSDWQWEVPVGMEYIPGRLHETVNHEVVVWLSGPGYCYHRRFQTEQGDAIQFHLKSFRPIPSVIGDKGGSSAMSIQDDHCDMPILTRSDANPPGLGRYRTGESTEEENRSCDRVSPTCSEFFGEDYGKWWLDDLIRDLN